MPVPVEDRPWIGAFLSGSRPTSVRQYWNLLQNVGLLLESEGHPIHLNARRFRHTTAVMLKRRGIPDTDIQDILAVAPQTLQVYARRSVEELADLLGSVGWGK